jgi:heat shock protein HtpX
MRFGKRILLFVASNVLIIATISIAMQLLGVQPYLDANGINYQSLLIFCVMWGFGGAFISLAMSRMMAKWMMGVKIIDPKAANPELRDLVQRVYGFSRQAGLTVMPEVGYYESPDLNAFATGPTKNRSLVAVSSGLLQSMDRNEVDGVLAHEVAHIANGDMVTMTLIQGVVNALVMFMARIAAFAAAQFVPEDKRQITQFAIIIGFELILGILGMIVVASFSRAREYRADAGGAKLAGKQNMIAALERLKLNYRLPEMNEQPAIASLKISGRRSGWAKFFATHPDLDDRIAKLR